jgi:hypothetical protein
LEGVVETGLMVEENEASDVKIQKVVPKQGKHSLAADQSAWGSLKLRCIWLKIFRSIEDFGCWDNHIELKHKVWM